MLEGIDLSVWQPSVDWALVAEPYVFIRAVYGTSRDTMFGRTLTAAQVRGHHWAAAKAGGKLRGAYAYDLPAVAGATQAQALLDTLGDDLGELPCVLDVETMQGLTTAQVVLDANDWCDAMQRAHPERRLLIYGSPAFLNRLPLGELPQRMLLWLADYTTAAKPWLAQGWAKWTVWQYSGSGTSPGVTGQVDRNRFDGTLDDLRALVNAGDPHVDAADPAAGSSPA